MTTTPKQLDKPVHMYKVVARLLPPTLTEETFRQAIQPNLLQYVTWLNFIKGRRKVKSGIVVNSRCYIGTTSQQLAEMFCTSLHGHTFVDEKGENFRAVACFAPYSTVPVSRAPDKRANTYETDPFYLKFLNPEPELSVEESNTQENNPNEETIAPVVLAIKEAVLQREQKKEQSLQKKSSIQKKKIITKVSTRVHPAKPKETVKRKKQSTPTMKQKDIKKTSNNILPIRILSRTETAVAPANTSTINTPSKRYRSTRNKRGTTWHIATKAKPASE